MHDQSRESKSLTHKGFKKTLIERSSQYGPVEKLNDLGQIDMLINTERPDDMDQYIQRRFEWDGCQACEYEMQRALFEGGFRGVIISREDQKIYIPEAYEKKVSEVITTADIWGDNQ